MRDGNSPACKELERRILVFKLPMRDGNLSPIVSELIILSVFKLPMRDGNEIADLVVKALDEFLNFL